MAAIRTSEPFISTSKDSPAYWLLDCLWVVHATGEQTRGSFSLVEQWMPEGAGPPPHVHPYEDESFWVIEGEMTVEVGGKTLVLGPGSLGHVPRNTVHRPASTQRPDFAERVAESRADRDNKLFMNN